MKVYVAVGIFNYEGEETFGIYTTHDLAFTELSKRKTEGHDSYRIDCFEVDGGLVLWTHYDKNLTETKSGVI